MAMSSRLIVAACGLMAVVALLAAAPAAAAKPAAGLYATANPPQLGMIDTMTAAFKALGMAMPKEGQAQQLSTIDPSAGIFYILGFNFTSSKPNLVGFSLADGSVVSNVDMPFLESGFVGVGQAVDADASTGDCIVMGQVAGGEHHVLRVDPKTGAVKKDITTLTGVDVLGGASCFDPVNQIEYLQLGYNNSGVISIDIYGIDVTTGDMHRIAMDVGDGHDISNMDYDYKAAVIYGFGVLPINATAWHRTVVALNPNTRKFNTVGIVPGYSEMAGGIAAVDSDTHSMYGYFTKKGHSAAKDPFYLINVDLDSGGVGHVSPPQTEGSLPWTFEYMLM